VYSSHRPGTLDVKNTFNSASWHHTLNALSILNVPVYIQRLIASYFEGRLLLYETDSGKSTHMVSGGVPQGSVLGPLLWNAMYDGILRITMPVGARLIGFAEDVAIVVTAKKLPNAERICNETGKRASARLDSKGLGLAAHKTEAVLISNRQKVEAENCRSHNYIASKPKILGRHDRPPAFFQRTSSVR